jgi:hypothetical protein
MNDDEAYIEQLTSNRVTLSDPNDAKDFPMDCVSIKSRNYFPTRNSTDYPYAITRNVYKDYVFLERDLAAQYSPLNWYCFAIDAKTPEIFKKRLRQLASCFPNVLVPEKELRMDSYGHNQIASLMECLNLLTKPQRNWNYVVVLQNHDIPLRTPREIAQIMKWLNGANDLETTHADKGRIQWKMDWSFTALRLFKNGSTTPILTHIKLSLCFQTPETA